MKVKTQMTVYFYRKMNVHFTRKNGRENEIQNFFLKKEKRIKS